VAYDPTGPVSGLTLGNGLVEQWTFGTSQKQPTRLVAAATQPDLSYKVNDTWTWGYNGATANNGNIVSATVYKTDWTGAVPVNASQSFGYDLVNRLTGSSESGVWTRNYGYDAWANGWVTANSGPPLNPFTPVASSNFDGNNRLGIQNSAYNTGGNQTAIGGFGNLYDAENRLLTSTIGGVTTTYSYDGDGRRVSKVTGATQSNYVYDAAGQLAAEYTSAAAQASACGTCYLTGDALGSTRMITDETATRRECHDYLPFGEEIPRAAGCYATSTGNTLKFTGKERDGESGLDHYEARYLASTQMRWIISDWSAKPEGVPYSDVHDPQTLNLYGYLRNDPLSRRDPDGHQQQTGPMPDTVCTEYGAFCRAFVPSPRRPKPIDPAGVAQQAPPAAKSQSRAAKPQQKAPCGDQCHFTAALQSGVIQADSDGNRSILLLPQVGVGATVNINGAKLDQKILGTGAAGKGIGSVGSDLVRNPDGTKQLQGLQLGVSAAWPPWPFNVSIPFSVGEKSTSDAMPTRDPWITMDSAGHWDEWTR
jgi:RHS repeat-associated protein